MKDLELNNSRHAAITLGGIRTSVMDSDVRRSGFIDRKVNSTSNQKKISLVGLVVSFVCYWPLSGAVHSAGVPGFDQQVDFNVREQAIGNFIEALYQEIDVPVSINSNVEGNVNGQFSDTARNVFNEISNAFSLIVYFDGVVAQVYRKNEVSRRLVPLNKRSSKRVLSIAKSMDLADSHNSLELKESGVLVTGTDRFLAQVDEIITSVKNSPVSVTKKKKAKPVTDKAVSFSNESPIVYQVFKLKHAWATDTTFPVGGQSIVVPGVATILQDLIFQENGTSGDVAPTREAGRLKGLKGQGLSRHADQANYKENQAALLAASGPRIVADSRLNAIVIRDREDRMGSYHRLIESLDVESGMVEIEATIIDINTDKTRDLGINWRYQGDNGSVLFGNGSASDQSLIPGANPITAQGQGGILSLSLGEPANFLARIRALEQQGAARIISKPHVITLSDVEAVLAATTEFFVRVAGEEEVDLFNVPVGTTLRVTPHIFTDNNRNRIKLLVNIEDGSQSSATQVDNIPVVERASISTQAVVNEGDSLLVGGLVRESYRDSGYQVPVLGKLPVLGGLFRSKQTQATRVERLFMITPRLATGIGFNGSDTQSSLAGSESIIVRDAENRLSTFESMSRRPVTYWSEQSRERQPHTDSHGNRLESGSAIRVEPELSIRAKSHEAGIAYPQFATIDGNTFITPFTVQEWVTE